VEQGLPPSPGLARSALLSPARAISAREALIAFVALSQPGLASHYAEELAGLDLANRDLAKLINAVLDRIAVPDVDALQVRHTLEGAGFGELLGRIDRQVGPSMGWCAGPQAQERDAEEVLKQALALHRRARALHKELKSAELALGTEATDANFNRLREIQAELSGIEGREATIEGFGSAAGRQSTGV
jgi:DNA primase